MSTTRAGAGPRGSGPTMWAQTNQQGTAMSETALCWLHFNSTRRRQVRVSLYPFVDCSGNEALACQVCGYQIEPKATTEDRLVILANSNVSRGKYAAAAVHAALIHYGIEHGAVIVLGANASAIEAKCTDVVHDAGLTEVQPGTVTAGIRR